jgi:hypothetical protein
MTTVEPTQAGAFNDNSEEMPLLSPNPPQHTPLPLGQIALLLLAQLTEPITSESILPYINEVRLTDSFIVLDCSRLLAWIAHRDARYHWWRR